MKQHTKKLYFGFTFF
jgi:molecular chaperone DnaK (HSP70)